MHIHSNPVGQLAQGSTQSTMRAQEARKAAAAVRRRLSSLAVSEDGDPISRVEAHADADPQHKKNPQHDEEAFRSIFFSISV